VPFGEYIPLRSIIKHFADLSLVPDDAVPGRGPGLLDMARRPGRLGVVISYEVFFADRARAAIRAGGELLLVPTNAASFKTGQVAGQELGAARLLGPRDRAGRRPGGRPPDTPQSSTPAAGSWPTPTWAAGRC